MLKLPNDEFLKYSENIKRSDILIFFLSKIFIKDQEHLSSAERRAKFGSLCGFVGIFLNLCLFAGKLFVGLLSGAISAVADAFNNLSDAASSLITLFGFRLANQKPDPDHPFGHGRFEYISCFIVSLLFFPERSPQEKATISPILMK